MNINFRMIVFWAAIVMSFSESTAFWWRSSDPPSEPQSQWPVPPAVYYQQRYLKSHQVPLPAPHQYQQSAESIAIPIQVPLQAQLAPVPAVHNVQLVPCLCPVQPEDFDKNFDQSANSKKDSLNLN